MNDPAPREILDALEIALRRGRQICVQASGLSMGAPFASTDGIVIQSADSSGLRPGMIVVYRRDNRWIVHRVIRTFGRNAEYLCVAKGDGVNRLDRPFVAREEYVGLVVGIRAGERTRMFTARDRIKGRWIALVGLLETGAVTAMRWLLRRCSTPRPSN